MTTLFINIKELVQVRELDVMKVSGKEYEYFTHNQKCLFNN